MCFCKLLGKPYTKKGFVTEFFRKGGGGLGPIHNFEAYFCASKVIEFFMNIESFGYFWAIFLKKIVSNIAILSFLGKLGFSPFCDQN